MSAPQPTINLKQMLAYKHLADPSKREVCFGGAAGGGKTWLGCEWLMRSAWAFPGTRWFVGRNNIKDSRESVLVTWSKVAQHYGFTAYKFTDSGILFDNGSEVVLLDLTFYPRKDPMFERLGSKEYTGGWIEEAGEVHHLAYEVLKSRIGRHLNKEYGLEPKLLITCNPKKNWLYKLFYKPSKSGTLDANKAFVQSLVFDNPFITQEYIDSLRSITSRQTRLRLLNGYWEYEGNANSLVDYDAILDCFTNSVQGNGQKRISADLAMKGRDHFVSVRWDGLVATISTDKGFVDAKQIEDILTKEAQEYGVRRSQIVADSDGLGAYLSAYLTGIKEFRGGASAYSSQFRNLKSECAYKLAEFINAGKLRIVCSTEQQEEIAEELEACLVAEDVDNDTQKKGIISKEEQKAVLGRSPDKFDALNMGMIYYVKPQPMGIRGSLGSLPMQG